MDSGIFDSDSHVIESADLWTDRISAAKWGDLVPHVRWFDDWQAETWFIGDKPVLQAWAPAVRGSAPGGFEDVAPRRLEDVHPSCIDPKERLKGMDEQGIAVEVLYPNIGLFGNLLPKHALELSFELISAYNDWLLEYWVATDPARFVPLAVVPFWDVAAAVREIERCAEKGHKGIITTGAPYLHGEPPMAHAQWNPMWEATAAADMSVSFHVGSGGPSSVFTDVHREAEGAAATSARGCVWAFLDNGKFVTELLFSGVLARYPTLKFITVESGVGWVPFVMEAADHQYHAQQVWRQHPEMDMPPSEYLRRQVYVNYWFERLEDHHIDAIGLDHILFETDFPHPTCLIGPDIQKSIQVGLGHREQNVRDRILYENAQALFKMPKAVRA